MEGHQPPYPPEIRQQTLKLLRIGRTPAELARAFKPTAATIRT